MKYSLHRNHPTIHFNKHYNYSVGSCHAKTALRHDYVVLLKEMKKDINVEYVRFHGIFCDDMHTLDTLNDILDIFPEDEKFIEENFYYVGLAYDNLLECGVKPFVELSFMPNMLAKEKATNKGFYGSNMNEPKNYEDWASYLTHFVEYLIERYGIEEVKQWPFEVWNEPDLYGAFFKGDQDAYYKLYKCSVLAIKAIHPDLQVGGPSTSASRWIASFVEYCKKENLPLDFITTHQYPGDPFTGVEGKDIVKDPNERRDRLKKNVDKLIKFIPERATHLEIIRMMFGDPTNTKEIQDNIFRDNARQTKEQIGEVPLYYTEWNLSAVYSAYSNDTKKAASYAVKTCLDIESYVTGTSFWCFSDIFEEMNQSKIEFHGGFGLQTIHGIKKPSYYALKFLSLLPEVRYDKEMQYEDHLHIGAFKEDKVDHIIVSRHYMKSIVVEDKEVEIEILSTSKPRSILIRKIDDTHCNPLKKWVDQGSKKYLTTKEVEKIKKVTQDCEEVVLFDYKENKITFATTIGINDVQYFTVNYDEVY